jgi:hypothetical protein
MSERSKHTYILTGSGMDWDGWRKWHLKRDDGKELKVNKARYRQLLHEGRIREVTLEEFQKLTNWVSERRIME